MAIFTVHQAKTQLSQLIARAGAGEEIIIARRDKRAVTLVPVAARLGRERAAGAGKGRFTLPESFFDPLPEEELEAWEGKYSFDG